MKDHFVYNTIPPKRWEDSIPVGNGRMGVTAMCGVGQEVLYLNEETICSKQERGEVDPHFPKNWHRSGNCFWKRRQWKQICLPRPSWLTALPESAAMKAQAF